MGNINGGSWAFGYGRILDRQTIAIQSWDDGAEGTHTSQKEVWTWNLKKEQEFNGQRRRREGKNLEVERISCELGVWFSGRAHA
jgi:hypothetical protein